MKNLIIQLSLAMGLLGCGGGGVDGIASKDSASLQAYLKIWKPLNDACFSAQDGNGVPYFFKAYGFEFGLQNLTSAYQFFSSASCDLLIGQLTVRYDLDWQISAADTQPRFIKINAFNGTLVDTHFLTAAVPDISVVPSYKDIFYTANGLLYTADPFSQVDAQGYPTTLSTFALYAAQ